MSKIAHLIFALNCHLDVLDKLQRYHKIEDTLETLVRSHCFQIDFKDLPALGSTQYFWQGLKYKQRKQEN